MEQLRTRHNCTKEGSFEFSYIGGQTGPKGRLLDIIKCKICSREWIEVRIGMQVIRKADDFMELETFTGK